MLKDRMSGYLAGVVSALLVLVTGISVQAQATPQLAQNPPTGTDSGSGEPATDAAGCLDHPAVATARSGRPLASPQSMAGPGTGTAAGLPSQSVDDRSDEAGPFASGRRMGLVDPEGQGRKFSIPDILDSESDSLGSMLGLWSDGNGSYQPPVIGDQSPFLPAGFRQPKVGAALSTNPAAALRPGSSLLFKLAGLKISDNQSPLPQDRVFYSFNYFDNVNAVINQRLGGNISNVNVYHNLFGIEKTFFGGDSSLGIRVPLDHITYDTTYHGFGNQGTALDDLSVFWKQVLLRNTETGSARSGGLDVRAPSGPGAFAGSPLFKTANPAVIQPFLGYFLSRDRWFFQGFSSIAVPTSVHSSSTLIFNDLCLGYYLYRAPEPERWISAIIPVLETHVNTPVGYVGYNVNDPRGVPNVVDMTFGTHLQFGSRSLLTLAYVDPVTGPRPFNGEFALFFNYFYGGSRRQAPRPYPPTL